MPIRKPIKKTWFNRLVTAPLVLVAWIILYPAFIPVAAIILFFTEFLPEIIKRLKDDWVQYTDLIEQATKFILGRNNNK